MQENNFLTQSHLARRWGISPRTLERWRWQGEGPCFIKIGGRVRYRLEDVEAYEASHSRSSTAPLSPVAGHASLMGGAV